MSDTSFNNSRISLYYRNLSDGRQSICLDYYYNEKRIRESLKLYLLPETSRKNIRQNKETIKKAQEIQKNRISELIAKDREIEISPTYKNISLEKLMKEYHTFFINKGSKSTVCNVVGLTRALDSFHGLEMNILDIDIDYCNSLVDFLRYEYQSANGKLKMTTARTYIYLFSGALNMATEKGFIPHNPLFFIKIHDRITGERPAKKHLSIDEIKLLSETQCPVISRPQVKQAFMFAIFTGLTAHDIFLLQWKDIKEINGRKHVRNNSRKIFVPLSSNALRWLPEISVKRGLIFKGLPKATETDNILHLWQKKAGVATRLNFSSARNTFAYLILSTGADTATLCSLMGITSKNAKGYLKMVDYKPASMEEKLKCYQLD